MRRLTASFSRFDGTAIDLDGSKRGRQIPQEITSDQRGFTKFVASDIAGEAVQVRAQNSSVKRRQALSHQGSRETCEHVSSPTRGHSRVSCLIDVQFVAIRDDCAMPFEYQHGTMPPGKLGGHFRAPGLNGCNFRSGKARKLARMRSENDR
jgi:hypothetical protein